VTAGATDGISLATVVAHAIDGDAAAWEQLVRRLERVVWKAVNMMTTDDEIRKDAFAATWLRLVERLDTIREPEKLPGWLTTTATNEVRGIIRHRGRSATPVDWQAPDDPLVTARQLAGAAMGDHEQGLVRDDDAATVRAAFAALDEDCRQLLTVLVLADPPLSYKEASELLGRPVGSLGPSRKRCLERLQSTPQLRGWTPT
jgi:RNA polymerase sigma factor (sigma-70 family)